MERGIINKLDLEIMTVSFNAYKIYGDIAGKEFVDTGETICGVFTK